MVDSPTSLSVPIDDGRDHVRGPADAPLALVEYGDYECSYCGRAFPIVNEVRRRLGGRLKFVFRNFPLMTLHPHAENAAEAAEAAASQGKFWEMHDTLFQNQANLGDQDLHAYAAELGLDLERFDGELAAHVYTARVREDFESGTLSGVEGTPAFYVNGLRHDGDYDVETLVTALEQGGR